MPHICIRWFTVSSLVSVYDLTPHMHQATALNQWWRIVKWTRKNKLQLNLNQNTTLFIQRKVFYNVVCKMAAILFRPQYYKPSDAVQRTLWDDRDLNEERLDAKCGHICDGDNTIGAITPPSEFRTQWSVLSPSSHPSLYSTLRPTPMKMYGNKCAVLLAMTCVVFNTLRPEQTGLPRLTLRSLYSCPRTGIVDPTTEMAMSSFWRNFRSNPSEVHSDHWQFNMLQGEYGLNVLLLCWQWYISSHWLIYSTSLSPFFLPSDFPCINSRNAPISSEIANTALCPVAADSPAPSAVARAGTSAGTMIIKNLGLYSLSGKTSYRQTSWSLEAARLDVIMVPPLWNLTDISAALLPRCLSNFRAIGKV